MPVAGFSYFDALFRGNYKRGLLNYSTVTTIPNSATANTFGAWTELIADSGARPTVLTYLVPSVSASPAAGSRIEIELGFGGVGAETTVAGVAFSSSMSTLAIAQVPIFCIVPPNTRISARVRDNTAASRNYFIALHGAEVPYVSGVAGIKSPILFQHNSIIKNNYSTLLTNITSSGTANTFGSWVELSANIGDAGLLFFAFVTSSDTTTSRRWEMEFGIGSAGNESAIASIGGRTPSDTSHIPFLLLAEMPAGSRLSARVRDGQATAIAYRTAVHWIPFA